MTSENYDGRAVLEALTANVLNTRFEDVEQEITDNTKRRILDIISNANRRKSS
jgi:shikimate kinase